MTNNVDLETEASILQRTERKLRAGSRLALAGQLLKDIRILVAMLRDRTFALSWSAKAVILGALAYFLLPTDSIPDIIPIVGYVDDGIVIGTVVKQLSTEIARYKEHLEWS